MEEIKIIECPQCKKEFKINPQMVGKKYRCKLCSGTVIVPHNFFGDQEKLLDEITPLLPPDPPVHANSNSRKSPKKINLRTAFGALALIVVSILAYIAVGPFITMYQIKSGIDMRDSEILNENIDYSALRENLKSQLNSHLMKKMVADLKDNPFAGLALAFASKLTDGMIESFVTPAGLSALLEEKDLTIIRSHRVNPPKFHFYFF
jgi:hypothetical protein